MTAPGQAPYPGSATRPSGYRRRRRRPLPAIVLLFVLGLVATIVWIRTLEADQDAPPSTACNAPTPATTTGEAQTGTETTPPPTRGARQPDNALDTIEPLPPDAVQIRVLNANGQRGQATLVAGALTTDLGFAEGEDPANDSLYPNFDMACHAQIRYGEAGAAAARTLSLAVPCAELVLDARPDEAIDLALGAKFTTLQPSAQAKTVLARLTALASDPSEPGGEQTAASTIDPTLLAAARSIDHC